MFLLLDRVISQPWRTINLLELHLQLFVLELFLVLKNTQQPDPTTLGLVLDDGALLTE